MRQYDIVVRLLFMYRMRVKGCACMGHDLAAARVKSWQWIIGRRMPRPHVFACARFGQRHKLHTSVHMLPVLKQNYDE